MITTAILIILAAVLILYTLFAGADFGAGVIGFLSRKDLAEKEKILIGKAMGPVWEANHIWLILMIVILFVGFPKVLGVINVYLHWPMTFVLIGIVFRGCAFVFMHYDAVKDYSQVWYQRIFVFASTWSSFWLGVCLGALSSGEMITKGDPYSLYFRPWLQPYPIFVGLFVVVVFAALASVYLLDETDDVELRAFLIKKSKFFTQAMVVLGIGVFGSSMWTDGVMALRFLSQPISMTFFGIATILVCSLYRDIKLNQFFRAKITCGSIVASVVVGWLSMLYPGAMLLDGVKVNFYDYAAPDLTMKYLFFALIIGLCLIVPSLSYLLWVFKFHDLKKE